MMHSTFQAVDAEKIRFEIRTTASLADWRKVVDALKEGREGCYGPAQVLIRNIEEVVRQAEREFYAAGDES